MTLGLGFTNPARHPRHQKHVFRLGVKTIYKNVYNNKWCI
jgi:hypothetical protein